MVTSPWDDRPRLQSMIVGARRARTLRLYFVIMGLGAAEAGAADEMESVTHAFQPSGRFWASNSL